jgi:macrolide transport system ATP-binding/permease protein
MRRDRFGFIFQRYDLLPSLNALENVSAPAIYSGTPRSLRNERASSLLATLGLADRMYYHPYQLSGGQQQRVSIARALMNGGQIILADEPTGALDSKVGQEVLEIFKSLHAQGHTIVLVTHDLTVAKQAARLIELKDGGLVAERSSQEPQRAVLVLAKERHSSSLMATRGTQWSNLASRLSEALRMAILAMKANGLRTFLTMLGIVIGIASVASVVALGQGGQQRILNMIRGIGVNTIDIYAGFRGNAGATSVETLMPSDAEAISQQGYVDSVTPTVSTTVSMRFRSASVSATVNGVGDQYFRVHGMTLVEGDLFTSADVAALAQSVVIDENTRKELFASSEPAIGQVVFLGSVPVRIVGVAKSVFLGPTLNVWAPYTAVMGRVSGQRHLKGITARVSDAAPSNVVQVFIERLLYQRHGRRDFYLNNTDTVRKTVEATTDTMRNVVLSIALVSLIVGGIGVMNIMLVSVTERTREIGIRMAVGARRSDILLQFAIEAVLVCVLGGVLGVAVSFCASFVLPTLFPQFPMIFSVYSVVVAVSVSTIVGLIFGFVPARNAAGLDPVEALARD